MAATVDDTEIAVASSGLYLSGTVGAVTGVSSAGAVLSNVLQSQLPKVLSGQPDAKEVRINLIVPVRFS